MDPLQGLADHLFSRKAAMPELNETDIHALDEALDDEYRAWATYDQVIRL
jgi:hypothetical protein